ncbi:type II toxin-antitoxin system RelE/ParE family toxin [Saxibacter everestensis]|uniref:Type II toxin-antitoxin system RelE/ParE family toxin n=1 Tax=Saxibacter everestensis TaxID=2909229 RepID=A0ABY8QUU0_9MICO|nr:type II toxin-antitoxin system RelE/ParE family toxin [Brevibacteriaceae bacterium ZFBP1038]
MSWDVQFAPSALRAVERLPSKIATAIIEFVTVTLPSNPERMSKPLRVELEGLRSACRGDYRVLFSMDETSETLLVTRIAHRSDVYGLR